MAQVKTKEDVKNLELLVDDLKSENKKLRVLEETLKQNVAKLTKLEQENYTLNKKQELHENMQLEFQEQLEALQNEKTVSEKKLKNVLESHKKEINEYNQQIIQLKNELSHSNNESQELKYLREEFSRMEAIINNNKKEEFLESKPAEVSFDQKLFESLQDENSKLLLERDGYVNKVKKMEEEAKKLKKQAGDLNEELIQLKGDHDFVVTEKKNLQKELKLFKARIDASNAKPDHPQGNSLFSEVEDRRAEVENLLGQLRVDNDSLKKKLQVTQDLLDASKSQNFSHWQAKELELCKVRITELEKELHEMKQTLVKNNHLINKKQDEFNLSMKKLQSAMPNNEKYKVYFALNDKRIKELSDNLENERMDAFSSKDALLTLQQELHCLQQEMYICRQSESNLKTRLEQASNSSS